MILVLSSRGTTFSRITFLKYSNHFFFSRIRSHNFSGFVFAYKILKSLSINIFLFQSRHLQLSYQVRRSILTSNYFTNRWSLSSVNLVPDQCQIPHPFQVFSVFKIVTMSKSLSRAKLSFREWPAPLLHLPNLGRWRGA